MILKKITIENYRSIEHLEIDILNIDGRKLHTFFGINETGKSNILKAIALLNPSTTVNYDIDCNKNAIKHSKQIIVTLLFETSKQDNLYEKIKSFGVNIITREFQSLEIEKVIKFNDKSIREECYVVHLSDRTQELTISGKQSNALIDTVTEIVIAAADFINKNNIEKCINAEAKAFFDSIIPEVIFWEPSDAYLITNQINLETFKQNPDISIPLKHIFYLAGYKKEEITKNVERIQTNGDIRADFEEDLSNCITNHINKIWPEHPINLNIIRRERKSWEILEVGFGSSQNWHTF